MLGFMLGAQQRCGPWRAAALGALLGLAGCEGPPPADPLAPRTVAVERRWAVLHEDRRIGTLTELRIDDPAGPITLYRAETIGGQWVGQIDGQGRFYQRVPFEPDDVFRGVHPMPIGLALLYEVDSPVRLEDLEPGVGTPPAATPGGNPL